MSELIERVAKRLYEDWAACFDVPKEWENAKDYSRAEFRKTARTAIEETREPTDAMCVAAFAGSPQTARDIWHAMVDEALK